MAPPLRLGLIGAGRWGQVYLRTLAQLGERCRVTMLCTRRSERAALVSSPVQVMAEWREAVRANACDAVIIATPSPTHAQIVEACLAAGLPCLVEKPFSMDLPTAVRVHERAVSSGVPVLVGHIQLFDPRYQAMRQALLTRREPIRALTFEGVGWGPFRPDTPALWDWGPHGVSLCVDLLGAGLERVTALAGPDAPDGQPGLVDLRCESAEGAVAWVQMGALSPVKRRALAVWTDRQLYWLDAAASGPAVTAEIAWAGSASTSPQELVWQDVPAASSCSPMESMLHHFIDGVQGGDRSRFGTSLAVEVTRVLAACEQAMHSGSGVGG